MYLDENSIVLMWIDKNEANNSYVLDSMMEQYKGKVLVQYFTQDEEFRKTVLEQRNSPSIIIMSASAAGSNTQWGDGDHFNFLKQNQKDLQIQGVIIYCGKNGYQNLCHLLEDESRLLKTITTRSNEMIDAIKNLIIPNLKNQMLPVSFNLVPIELIQQKLPNLKMKMINKVNSNNLSSQNISAFILNNQLNIHQIFKEGKEIMESIKMDQNVIDSMQKISENIEELFTSRKSDKTTSNNFFSLYSQDHIYTFLNSTLNSLNENLLTKMEYIFDMFSIALKINSQNSTFMTHTLISKIYRGSVIPQGELKEATKIGKDIVQPSFSSFYTNSVDAANFISMKLIAAGKDTHVPVLYEFEFFLQQDSNSVIIPKCVARIAETEYVVLPFTRFKISKYTPSHPHLVNKNNDLNELHIITLKLK